MFVVAITTFGAPLAEEAAALAAALGLAAYDVRTRLGGVLPAVVYQSSSAEDAARALGAVRARGHRALLCDTRDVTATRAMVEMHRFTIDPTSVRANDASGEELCLDDIGALIVATTRTDVVRSTLEKRLESRGGRPAVTVVHEPQSHEHVDEHAAYLFLRADRATGRRPWVLRERTAQYLSLGPRMRSTQHENFAVTVELLRERAPQAVFDDRFAVKPRTASDPVHVRGHDTPIGGRSDGATDLAVHLLAHHLLTSSGGPYR